MLSQKIYTNFLQEAQRLGKEKSCADREQYRTEKEAEDQAEKLNSRKNHAAVQYFPCPFCHRWHVGNLK